jgi:hypothetical protein
MTSSLKTLIGLLFTLLLISCGKDPFEFLDGPWVTTSDKNIILYTRPQNYTGVKSPDSIVIKSILSDQNNFIDTINSRLKIKYTGTCKIYLFNSDEAKRLIGTNTGGKADYSRSEIYYTFFSEPFYYPEFNLNSYLGFHELTHIVSFNVLGQTNNKLMSEGYACFLDNSYGAKYFETGQLVRCSNHEWMQYYVKNNLVLTPKQLFDADNIPEQNYYPQAGTFIKWLFSQYGVEKINMLFNVDKASYKSKFKELLNKNFDDLEADYIQYCQNEFK